MKKPFGNKSKRPFAPSGGAFDGFRKSSKPREEQSGERPRFGAGKPAWKSSRDENDRRPGGAPPWKKKRPGGGKPAWKRDRDDSERPSRGDDRGGDRPAWQADRPAWKDRPSYNQGPGSKPRKSYQQPSEFRRKWDDEGGGQQDRPRKSFGGAPKPYGGSKPYGKPKPYGQREDRFERPGGKRFERPGGNRFEKPDNRFNRPGGDRYERPDNRDDRRPPYRDDRRPDNRDDRRSNYRDERRTGFRDERRSGYRDDRRPEKRFDRPYSDRSDRPRYDKPEGQRFNKSSDSGYPSRDRTSAPANQFNQPEETRTEAPRKLRPFNPPPRTDGPYAKPVVLAPDDRNNVSNGVVWVYDSMVGQLPDGDPVAGDTVFVYDEDSQFLGSAIYNPNSRIRARVFSLTRTIFSQAYIREALVRAVKIRKDLGLLKDSCRVVFAESDGLPGLTADKIGGYLVIQPLTHAVERHLPFIIDRLNELIAPDGIVVRRDAAIRIKEGLEVGQPEIHGETPERVLVRDSDVTMVANITSGQKTGLFLDRRFNRDVIKPWCNAESSVLDLFCHAGGWALKAAKYGAAEVLGVDSSRSALDLAEAGAEASGLTNVSFVEDDVFDYLRGMDSDKSYDVIVSDPPAFAKTRKHYEEALRAYVSLNELAMQRLKPGGILVTCSCSQAFSVAEFNEAVLTAARNAGMQFQVLERRGASADYPALLGFSESEYLKCFVLRRTE